MTQKVSVQAPCGLRRTLRAHLDRDRQAPGRFRGNRFFSAQARPVSPEQARGDSQCCVGFRHVGVQGQKTAILHGIRDRIDSDETAQVRAVLRVHVEAGGVNDVRDERVLVDHRRDQAILALLRIVVVVTGSVAAGPMVHPTVEIRHLLVGEAVLLNERCLGLVGPLVLREQFGGGQDGIGRVGGSFHLLRGRNRHERALRVTCGVGVRVATLGGGRVAENGVADASQAPGGSQTETGHDDAEHDQGDDNGDNRIAGTRVHGFLPPHIQKDKKDGRY